MNRVKHLPRPPLFVVLYAYSPSNGRYSWNTGVPHLKEEDAIAEVLGMSGVEKAHVVRIEGLETFCAPDTLKSLTYDEGDVIEYTEDEDEGHVSD